MRSSTHSTPPATAVTGCATSRSTGAAVSPTATRRCSKMSVSALPRKISTTDRSRNNGSAKRWAAALTGAVSRNTETVRSRKPRLHRQARQEPPGRKTRYCEVTRRMPPSTCRLDTVLVHADEHVPQRLHLFQGATGAEGDAGERILGDRHREPGGVA